MFILFSFLKSQMSLLEGDSSKYSGLQSHPLVCQNLEKGNGEWWGILAGSMITILSPGAVGLRIRVGITGIFWGKTRGLMALSPETTPLLLGGASMGSGSWSALEMDYFTATPGHVAPTGGSASIHVPALLQDLSSSIQEGPTAAQYRLISFPPPFTCPHVHAK